MAPPMQNNLEILKIFIRANALRKIAKMRRRSSGNIFSMTKEDIDKIIQQMRKSCKEIARAEEIAKTALNCQAQGC